MYRGQPPPSPTHKHTSLGTHHGSMLQYWPRLLVFIVPFNQAIFYVFPKGTPQALTWVPVSELYFQMLAQLLKTKSPQESRPHQFVCLFLWRMAPTPHFSVSLAGGSGGTMSGCPRSSLPDSAQTQGTHLQCSLGSRSWARLTCSLSWTKY